MDKEFWFDRYKHNDIPRTQSLFADHCVSEIFKPGCRVLELGHGNGRDAFFFTGQDVEVIGIDQAGKVLLSDSKMKLLRGDFTDSAQVMNALLKNPSKDWGTIVDHIYSRFTWHSITEEEENNIISWAPKVLKSGGSLLIECRTIYDELYGEGRPIARDTFHHNDHNRRFIRPGELVDKLLLPFDTVESSLSREFAPSGSDHPLMLRINAKIKR